MDAIVALKESIVHWEENLEAAEYSKKTGEFIKNE